MSSVIDYGANLLTEEERRAIKENFYNVDELSVKIENDRYHDLAVIAVNARIALAAVLNDKPVDPDSIREIIAATERLR